MEMKVNNKKERQYYIDWLRILLIFSVFLFHVGMVFNSWDWHIKNDPQYPELRYIMSFLHVWRMPLLFLVSGVGTFYALRFRSSKQYLGERTKRLIIPLIAGIFILVPVQVYIEKMDQFESLLDFYPHMFEGIYPIGNFSWHHLWFIVYLFVIALIISPFLKFIRSEKFKRFQNRLISITSKRLGTNIFLIPLIISQLLLRPFFEYETHALVDDWAYFTYNLIFFITGLILFSNNKIAIALKIQRRLYLLETIISTSILLSVYFIDYGNFGGEVWDIFSIIVAWSCSMTALGYARTYMNKDSKLRKLANEAIYPFYLLHQPLIIIVALYVIRWDISVIWKAIFVTSFSFGLSVGIYWFIIRPINILRIIFGLKPLKSEKAIETNEAEPITIQAIEIRKTGS